jgi:pimeloyl-ACP methyl ester carboxylesterase
MTVAHDTGNDAGIRGALGIGVGYGGHVLTSLALHAPSMLAALVLVSPSCGSAGWAQRLWHTTLQPVAHGLSEWVRAGGSARHKARDAERLVERRACCRDTSPSEEVLSAYRDLTLRRRNLLQEAQALKAPMLLFVGTASPFAQEG